MDLDDDVGKFGRLVLLEEEIELVVVVDAMLLLLLLLLLPRVGLGESWL